jgi:pimeloyl-ACP methyl ester carboxylesterase
MDRRNVLRMLWAATVLGGVPSESGQGVSAQESVTFDVYGADSSPALFLGPPFAVVQWPGVSDDRMGRLRQEYLSRLVDRYRVIVLHYPPQSDDPVPLARTLTPDRWCRDILAAADAAHADRFAWFGYSGGGVVGLQLASRTDRLTALVCGGWPPLDGPYKEQLAISEKTLEENQDAIAVSSVAFCRPLKEWADRETVSTFTCPSMTFAGNDDVTVDHGYTTRIGPTVARTRDELVRMGWTVNVVNGFGHELFNKPDIVVSLMREFLDPILLRN